MRSREYLTKWAPLVWPGYRRDGGGGGGCVDGNGNGSGDSESSEVDDRVLDSDEEEE